MHLREGIWPPYIGGCCPSLQPLALWIWGLPTSCLPHFLWLNVTCAGNVAVAALFSLCACDFRFCMPLHLLLVSVQTSHVGHCPYMTDLQSILDQMLMALSQLRLLIQLAKHWSPLLLSTIWYWYVRFELICLSASAWPHTILNCRMLVCGICLELLSFAISFVFTLLCFGLPAGLLTLVLG